MKKFLVLIVSAMLIQPNILFAAEGKKMTRSDICKKNYEKLFNSDWNPNVGSDPEMMAILQKYIFGEVFTVGNLDMKTREMLTVTSLAVQQTLPQLKAHINAALNVGVTPLEVRETLYQCAPFIGFPKTLNAIGVMNEVFKERGIETPLEMAGTTDEKSRFEKGAAIQKPLYGDEISKDLEGLPENMGEDVARFLTEFCFGDIYTRNGLDVKKRELMTISILVTTGDTETLKSHIKGALKAGNSKETITAAMIQCLPYVGFPKTIAALKCLKGVI